MPWDEKLWLQAHEIIRVTEVLLWVKIIENTALIFILLDQDKHMLSTPPKVNLVW